MRSPVRILLLVLLLFFGYYAIGNEFGGYEIIIFSIFNYINFIIVAVLLIPIFIIDLSYFRNDKKIYQMVPSLIGILIAGTVIFRFIQRESIGNSITRLSVRNLPGARNVWHFEFKEKGHFKLADYNILGQTLYYGRYTIQHDSLIIKRSNYDGDEKNFPAMGLIKNDTMFWIGADTMIIEKPK